MTLSNVTLQDTENPLHQIHQRIYLALQAITK
jgi:hypothetical protein